MNQLPVSKGFSATLVKDGDKGDPAVSYQISLAGSRFWVDQDAVKMYVDIKGSILKSVGGTISPFTPTSSMLKLYFDGVGGRDNIPDADVTISGNTFSTTKYNDSVWDGENMLVATLTIDGVMVAGMSIQVEVKGATGAPGTSAKLCFIAGDYSDDITYTSNAKQTVAVTVPTSGDESEVWLLEASTNVVNGVHIAPHDSGQRVWSRGLNGYNLIVTKFLFADFAKLGAFVVVGKYFISQYGTLYRYYNGSVTKYNEGASYQYNYFDVDDPLVEVMPTESNPVKWRPVLCIDAERGTAYFAGGKIKLLQNGSVEMENAVIKGSLFYHKVLRSSIDPSVQGAELFTYNSTSGEYTLDCDYFILTGAKRSNGFTVFFPPASRFQNAKIKLVNATYSGGNGTAAQQDKSKVELEVVHHGSESKDDDAWGYIKNTFAAAVPFEIINGSSRTTIVGAPNTTVATTDFGIVFDKYTSIELVSQLNPWIGDGQSYWTWMIVDARQ